MDDVQLVKAAIAMLPRAYVPYSHYHVGAALLGADGKVYTGCNIENASYGVTNCAERTALFKAVSEGCRRFTAIAVVGGPDGMLTDYAPPCGICRQALAEFCDPTSFRVILARSPEDICSYTLAEILPLTFTPEYLQRESESSARAETDMNG